MHVCVSVAFAQFTVTTFKFLNVTRDASFLNKSADFTAVHGKNNGFVCSLTLIHELEW